MENHNGAISKEDVCRSLAESYFFAEEKGSGAGAQGAPLARNSPPSLSAPGAGPGSAHIFWRGFFPFGDCFMVFRRALFAERHHARAPRAALFAMISARGPAPTAALPARNSTASCCEMLVLVLMIVVVLVFCSCCARACAVLVPVSTDLRRLASHHSLLQPKSCHVTAFRGAYAPHRIVGLE
jgi:hypothetical protein